MISNAVGRMNKQESYNLGLDTWVILIFYNQSLILLPKKFLQTSSDILPNWLNGQRPKII
jgi:hypothetical protein